MLSRLLAESPRFFTIYTAEFLLQAALTTLALSAGGCLVGLVLGFGIAVLRRTRGLAWLPARIVAIGFSELFRRIPFLVNLFLVFYATQVAGLEAPVFAIAMVSVCLIASAYLAEIGRAGLDSVHPNQWDSAAVCNFTAWQTLRLVVIPQAWKVILPPAFGFFLLFIKDSALASQIGLLELTYAGRNLNNRGFMPLLSFGSILLLYFALSYPLTLLGRRLEARLANARHR
ncbi:MAG: amino acid ABC transporter permease [Proteobacteria bacterium]|nr:amino acid ABC transporter permease [Pseudomonadota bacterium]